jgi:hypothetical protein
MGRRVGENKRAINAMPRQSKECVSQEKRITATRKSNKSMKEQKNKLKRPGDQSEDTLE